MSSNNTKYCVYLTIYSGNKLPPFYIGSTKLDNIQNGYNGSVGSKEYKAIWNKERKLNKHLFKTKIISMHISREEAYKTELRLQEQLKVIINPMYINMSYARANGFFGQAGKAKTQEHKNNISKAMKGIQNTLGYKHKEESKNKISLAKTGKPFSEEHKKNMRQPRSEEHKKNTAAAALKRSNRENVIHLRCLVKEHGINLGRGWPLKSDEWINNALEHILSEQN